MYACGTTTMLIRRRGASLIRSRGGASVAPSSQLQATSLLPGTHLHCINGSTRRTKYTGSRLWEEPVRRSAAGVGQLQKVKVHRMFAEMFTRPYPQGLSTAVTPGGTGTVSVHEEEAEISFENDLQIIPCKAHYVARGIDTGRVYQTCYNGLHHRFQHNCVIVSGPFPKEKEESPTQALTSMLNNVPGAGNLNNAATESVVAHVEDESTTVGEYAMGQANSHVVIFKYGSVVFFNFSTRQREAHLKKIRKQCVPLPPSYQQCEDHMLAIFESLEEPSRMESSRTILRQLDMKNVQVISTIMGQTVALDHYGVVVDEMIETFTDLNSGLERTGRFSKMEKQRLFQLVAKQNTVFTDVISKLGLLEKSETAWKHPDYHMVWEALRSEFELESRFKNLDFKLNLIQHNTKYFLEILHNQKSDNLEWIIIILIAMEIIVSLADMAGVNPFEIWRKHNMPPAFEEKVGNSD